MFDATELEINASIWPVYEPRILPGMLMAISRLPFHSLNIINMIDLMSRPRRAAFANLRIRICHAVRWPPALWLMASDLAVTQHGPGHRSILARQFATFSRLSSSTTLPIGSSTHDRRLLSGSDLYHPGLKIHLQFQAQDTTTFRPLVAKIVKHIEPFTSSTVLLIQQISDSSQFILKLNDRRLGHRPSLNVKDGELPWTPALEECLRAAGHLIPHYYGLVHFPISPSEPLHLITDYVPGIVVEYIQGVSMGSLQPGVNIPRPEAESIADRVMDAFRTIKAEKCVMHNDVHIDNIVLRDSDRSPVLIDFGWALTREPRMSDQEWEDAVAGCQDVRFARNVLLSKEHGVWRRKETPLPIHCYSPLAWNEYVENQPDDYRRQTFERVLGTDWEGPRENGLQWRQFRSIAQVPYPILIHLKRSRTYPPEPQRHATPDPPSKIGDRGLRTTAWVNDAGSVALKEQTKSIIRAIFCLNGSQIQPKILDEVESVYLPKSITVLSSPAIPRRRQDAGHHGISIRITISKLQVEVWTQNRLPKHSEGDDCMGPWLTSHVLEQHRNGVGDTGNRGTRGHGDLRGVERILAVCGVNDTAVAQGRRVAPIPEANICE
ncbi:hypothetical protein ARMGADRAFT_1039141 [Armillaria gallica]|uniref:Protein kinase domain-containing protein n=1 Tax=Armillaria gallica TaxID=47427 RepID=A0A2H3CFB3_ARMGA|nr:hypothetical protein ARMGADRAFT_1039141 [Armillaria gallica]